MQLDFSKEKIITVVVALAAFFIVRALPLPDYGLHLVILIIILGWGPDIWRSIRRR